MSVQNTDHALFVLQEYRKAIATNPGVLALNDGAGHIDISTSLNEATAEALADKILAENEHPRLFEHQIEGLLWLDFFIGGPPQWQVIADHDALNQSMKGISTSIDFNDGISTVEVRG